MTKDSVNAELGNRYASLHHVVKTLQSYLPNYGIDYYQPVQTWIENGRVYISVSTIACDLEGNVIDQIVLHAAVPDDAPNIIHWMASAITYFRRLGLIYLFGLVPQDDDGNAASTRPVTRPITPNQIALLERLAKEGKVEKRDFTKLTMEEASTIITEALR